MSDVEKPTPLARAPIDLAGMLAKYNADGGGMTGHLAEVGVNAVDAIDKATANQFKAPAEERTKQVRALAWHESMRAIVGMGLGGALFGALLVVAAMRLDSPDLLTFLAAAVVVLGGLFAIHRLRRPPAGGHVEGGR